MLCEIESVNISMLGNGFYSYEFILIKVLESNAIFIEWSVFTVITIGEDEIFVRATSFSICSVRQ